MFSADGSLILARTNAGHYRRWLTDAARLDEEFAWLSDGLGPTRLLTLG